VWANKYISRLNFKDAMPVSLNHNCLHFTFEPYLIFGSYSHKYEKLPNIVTHACKNITEKIDCVQMDIKDIIIQT